MQIVGSPDLVMLHRAAEFGRSDAVINERLTKLERLAEEVSSQTNTA
jgi:hypothetical protein